MICTRVRSRYRGEQEPSDILFCLTPDPEFPLNFVYSPSASEFKFAHECSRPVCIAALQGRYMLDPLELEKDISSLDFCPALVASG